MNRYFYQLCILLSVFLGAHFLSSPFLWAGTKKNKKISDTELCQAGEMNVSEEYRKAMNEGQQGTHLEVLYFLNKRLTRDLNCFLKSEYMSLVRLTDAVRREGLRLTLLDNYQLIANIQKNWRSWRAKANSNGPAVINVLLSNFDGTDCDVKCDKVASVYVRPNGNLIVSAQDKYLGRGTHKNVYTRLGIALLEDQSFEIKILAALVPIHNSKNSSPNTLSKSEKNFRKESLSFLLIRGFKMQHSLKKIRGVAEAEVLTINGKRILIQEKYQSDLEESHSRFKRKFQPHILNEIAHGLEFIHAIGLVHGDLKEKNILANPDVNQFDISDFGLTFDPKEYILNRSTADYEAPEMVDQEHLDTSDDIGLIQKRDIYSFGIIGLHMIPKHHLDSLHYRCSDLFAGYHTWGEYGDCIKLQSVKLHKEIIRISDQNCKFQERTYCREAIVADCLNPDPRLRPTASELRVRTEGLVQTSPIEIF